MSHVSTRLANGMVSRYLMERQWRYHIVADASSRKAVPTDHKRFGITKPSEGMQVPTVSTFTMKLRVSDDDIDPQGHVNNVSFLRFVQEAAIAHWRAVASSELRAAVTWVVRRHEIEYLQPGLPGDELIVRTWVGERSGATWERFTEIRRVDGGDRPIVTARTVWVLLDAVSKRPRRADAGLVAQFVGGDIPSAG